MIRIENNQILLEYQQHATTKNKKYNYKEVTIPSDIYNYWTQRNNNRPVNEVTVFTLQQPTANVTYITPERCSTTDFGHDICHMIQLKIRLNISRSSKKPKKKATMNINKHVHILCDDITFILDPNQHDFNTNVAGLCTVEGLEVLSPKEKKVGKEKKVTKEKKQEQ